MLDNLIYGMAGLLLAIAFCLKSGRIAALVVISSLLIDKAIFNAYPTWGQLHHWAVLLSIKDFAFAALIGFRHKMKELPLLWCFSISGLLHQWLVVEIENQNLTLFYHRPDIMSVLVAGMLSSVIISLYRGGSDGGKRAKSGLFHRDTGLNYFFHFASFKVKKL